MKEDFRVGLKDLDGAVSSRPLILFVNALDLQMLLQKSATLITSTLLTIFEACLFFTHTFSAHSTIYNLSDYDAIDLPVFTCSSRDYVRLKGLGLPLFQFANL